MNYRQRSHAMSGRSPGRHDRRNESPRGGGGGHKMKRNRSGSNHRDDRERDRERGDRGDRRREERAERDDRYRESKHYRSRSHSRSDRHYKATHYSRSRSRSGGRRSPSHSPTSNRRRHVPTRENPKPSCCLGVFGMSIYTTEVDLYHIFYKFGPVDRVQVVIDAMTGTSRGFAFVYFENQNDAKAAMEECNGLQINGKKIRVEYSITERAHSPTPGIYKGRPSYSKYDRRGGRDRDRDRDRDRERDRDEYKSKYSRRSPSPPRRKRYERERSRSRSYTPRHY